MQVYNYHPITGEYVGKGVADPSPAEPGEFLLPAFSTSIEPPVPGSNQAAVYQSGAWALVPDYRGSTWWKQDGTQYIIDELGTAPEATDTDHDPRPSVYHVWSGSEYVLDREAWLNSVIRPQRDQLLDAADLKHCNADKWESMTEEQKTAWRAYKQALRDLPASIDYDNPVWPTIPE
jgi:hypothetical protein